MTREYLLDGSRITSLEAFYDEVSLVLGPGAAWGRNLDAFNDILRGVVGTPAEGFTLHWMHAEVSRQSLGYEETVRQLEPKLAHCHPANRDAVRADLARARRCEGPTVFEWLIEIIRDHGVGGEQSEDKVLIVLD